MRALEITLGTVSIVTLFGLTGCERFASGAMNTPTPGARLSVSEARALLEQAGQRPVQAWPEELVSRDQIPAGPEGELIRRGVALLERTSELLGPNAPDPAHRVSHNNLNCVSCHPAGPSGLPGTRPGRLPFVAVVHEYPKVKVKTMQLQALTDQVRGMLGTTKDRLPDDAPELRAILAYFEFLGRFSEPGKRVEGTGIARLEPIARAADPARGKQRFEESCAPCHQATGKGRNKPGFEHGAGYLIPPIAGDDTYTDGGHMYLIPVFARFIYGYMPIGASPDEPMMSPEDAYDIAAYVNEDLPRRHAAGREHLYPAPELRPAFFSIPELFAGDPEGERRAKLGPFSPRELDAEF